MSSLPPVFVEFIGVTGAFKSAVRDVEAGIARVDSAGAGAWKKLSKGAAIGLAAVSAATIDVGLHAVKMAADFQSSMTLLETAGGEQAKNMNKVASGVMNLATKTGVSTQSLLEGAYIAEKAGYHGADMLKVLTAATEASVGEHVDEATALSALTSVMQSYGYKASQAIQVENMLVRGSSLAKTTYAEFADSLSNVLPNAAKLNVSFAQVAGAIDTMTQHGDTAQRATQDLNNLILNLAGSNNVAVQAMAQLNINSAQVAKTLSTGPDGLANAIRMVTTEVEQRMGPDGFVLVDTLKKSAAASNDAQLMLAQMPPKLRELSQEFADGSLSMSAYRKDFRGMGADQYAMGSQFMTLETQLKGYNAQIKAGTPAQQTAVYWLKQMFGGETGLSTALMLTGNSAGYAAKATNAIAAAGKQAGTDIEVWGLTQKNFNVQLDRLHQAIDVIMIKLGQKLIPILEKAAQWFAKHTTLVKDLAIALGVTAAGAVVVWAGTVIANLAKGGAAIVRWVLTPITSMITRTADAGAAMSAMSARTTVAMEEEATATETASSRMVAALERNKLAMAETAAAAQAAADRTVVADEEMAAANDGAAASSGRMGAGLMGAAGSAAKAVTVVGMLVMAGDMLGRKINSWVEKNNSFAKSMDNLNSSAADLTTALVNNQGQTKQVSEQWIQAQLASDGLTRKAAAAGITQEQLTRAVMGGAGAMRQLIDQWRASGKPSSDTLAALGLLESNYQRVTQQTNAAELAQMRMNTALRNIPRNPTTTWTLQVNGLSQVTAAYQAIQNASGAHLNTVTSGGSTRSYWIGASGGWIPGPKGAPRPGIGHGGEYVLSEAMLAGMQPVDSKVLQGILSGGRPLSAGNAGARGAAPGVTVIVNVQGSVIDTQGLAQAVETAMTQHGARNSYTYQAFAR